MTSEILERVDVLRRIAENGRDKYQFTHVTFNDYNSKCMDDWQHMIDEIQLLKRAVKDGNED